MQKRFYQARCIYGRDHGAQSAQVTVFPDAPYGRYGGTLAVGCLAGDTVRSTPPAARIGLEGLKTRMGATARCLGEAIRAARTQAGLTLRGLDHATHGRFRASAVGGYERGERDISVERLVDLAYALHTTPEELLADAMRRLSPRAHVEVAIDLYALGTQGDTPAVRAIRAFTHATQLRRKDLMGDVITIRAGDLEVIARDAGTDVPSLLHAIDGAVRRVGPG